MSKLDDCPNAANHTDMPEGFINRYDWVVEKSKTHRQSRCPGCGFWVIWTPHS